MLTSQYNNARQDTNLNEPILSSSNVASGTFGAVKAQFLFDTSGIPSGFTNDPAYAQPLYVYQLTSGVNVIFVATLNGEVYAFDADNTSSPTIIWSRDETNSTGHKGLKHDCDSGSNAGKSVPDPVPYLDFAGVISTPVIDIGNGVIYVVNECETMSVSNSQTWYLNALNIYSGDTFSGSGSPVAITYSVSGSSPPSWQPSGPQQNFAAPNQLQRASLLFTGNGDGKLSVLVGFGTGTYEGGAHAMAYQGWLFDYNVSSPSSGVALAAPTNPFSTQCLVTTQTPTGGSSPTCTSYTFSAPTGSVAPNPCGDGGGNWMASRGPAAAAGNVFLAVGNGGFQYCAKAEGCSEWCTYNPPTPTGTYTLTGPQQFTDWGDAVMTIDMTNVWSASATSTQPAPFWPVDYFLPYTDKVSDPSNCGGSGTSPCTYFQILNQNDWDLGIFGVVLYDDCYYNSGTESTNCDTSLALAGDKRGDAYAMLQSGLGQYAGPDANVSTSFLHQSPSYLACDRVISETDQCDEVRSVAYWKPYAMNSGVGGFLVAWPWSESLSSYQWVSSGPPPQYNFVKDYTMSSNPWSSLTLFPGGTLAMTVNVSEGSCGDTAAAVVWATASPTPGSGSCGPLDARNCTGYLVAYKLDPGSPCTSGTLSYIWSATLPSTPDFEKAPYAIPTVVNGKAYVPTYGLYDSVHSNYDLSGIQVYACSSSDCE